MDLSTKTVTELKAMVYDALAAIEMHQGNIKALNAEIEKKLKEEKKAE